MLLDHFLTFQNSDKNEEKCNVNWAEEMLMIAWILEQIWGKEGQNLSALTNNEGTYVGFLHDREIEIQAKSKLRLFSAADIP